MEHSARSLQSSIAAIVAVIVFIALGAWSPIALAKARAQSGAAKPVASAKKAARSAKGVAGRGAKGSVPSAAAGAGRRSREPVVIRTFSPPPAAAPTGLVSTRFALGCLGGAALQAQLGPAAVPQLESFGRPLLADGAAAAQESCMPFASARVEGRPESTWALMPHTLEAQAEARALVLVHAVSASGPEVRVDELPRVVDGLREVWVPAAQLQSEGAAAGIPLAVSRELALLVRHMLRTAGAGEDALVRVLLDVEGDGTTLQAVELIDPLTLRPLDSALWMDREGEPGAYVSTQGTDLERALWQSPVDFRRISRGVGTSSMLVQRRVVVKPKGRAKPRVVVRAFRYLGQHIGIDFAAPPGTPVVSVADGEVVFAGWRGGYGNLLIVQHGGEITTHYAHLSAFAPQLTEGMKVRRGQEIGQVGSTGFSTGPHLHFEIRLGGHYVDPANPEQRLAVWTPQPHEHERVVVRLLQLESTRARGFTRLAAGAAPATRVVMGAEDGGGP